MKKIIAAVLCISMAFVMVSCGLLPEKIDTETEPGNTEISVSEAAEEAYATESDTVQDEEENTTEETAEQKMETSDTEVSDTMETEWSYDISKALSPSPSYTYSGVNKLVRITTNLNIRSGPSEDYDVLGTFSAGTIVYASAVCNETGWYRVEFLGDTGYCDAAYMEDVVLSPETEPSDGIVTAGDDGVNGYYVALCQQAYNQAPEWVRTEFQNHGWHMMVRSGEWWKEFGYEDVSLMGLTITGDDVIYIDATVDACGVHTVYHELGHFVDSILDWPSQTEDFVEIYNSEFEGFCEYYQYTNGEYNSEYELFAEALYHYWTNPGMLATIAPLTFLYIDGLLGN